MTTRISVIIPTFNEAACIGPLLSELGEAPGVEVIVSDGGSEDGTLSEVAQYPSVKWVSSVRGRGNQLNKGAVTAKGQVFWFLHADSSLPKGWQETILRTLKQPNVVAGSFHLKFDEEHRLLRFFSYCSRWNRTLFTYGDQGYFMTRRVFNEAGGFRNYPILEDVEIQCRLRKIGDWKKTDLALVTSARRFVARGILRQQLKNICIVSLFLAGASPHWLCRFYQPQSEDYPSASAQSDSRNPTALKESDKRKGRLTRFPFWVRSFKASFLDIVGSLSFKPKAL